MDIWITTLVEDMCLHIGRTVTIFTTSGGLSGSGFTGVLISCDCNCIRLLCDIGAAPACPVGSSCTGVMGACGMNGGYGAYNPVMPVNPLGAIAVIPTRAIACFTHNAI